jgi:ribosomal protein S18 acetylase RimI-like enzyme
MGKNINEFTIRLAELKDSKRIWEIRNHPLMRKLSGNQEEISPEKHISWFENKYFGGADNLCFVLESQGKVAGYCRFDSDQAGNYVISIALAYGYQGNGLGHSLLSGSLNKLKTGKEVIAIVKKENESSLKLFKKNNFKLDKEDEENFYFKYGKNCIS